MAIFASKQKDQAIFVSAAWGLAGQIYCYGQGVEGLVVEPFWNYGGAEDLRLMLAGWAEASLEDEVTRLRHAVRIRKYVRAKSAPNEV